jgi:hypothetical protein
MHYHTRMPPAVYIHLLPLFKIHELKTTHQYIFLHSLGIRGTWHYPITDQTTSRVMSI